MGMSERATSTSTVSTLTTGSGFTSDGLSERLASRAAIPPAAIATLSTTRRAAFITLELSTNTAGWPRKPHGGADRRLHRISSAKGQGMVKQRCLNRVNIRLRAACWLEARARSRDQMPKAGIQPVFG